MQSTDHRDTGGANRVVVCLGGGDTTLEQRPIPRPATGEILLRLRVVGFCGTDLFKLQTDTAVPGSVLGHELVGDVIETGLGVEKFAVGDRIAVPHHVPCGECAYCRRGSETMCDMFRENLLEPGGFADTVLVRRRAADFAARVVPDFISDEAAVFMEPAACVLRGVERSGIQDGSVAVVIGAGSMGLLHLLVLRAARADMKVVMVDPVAERRELAEKLGAARGVPPGSPAADCVSDLTEGLGADAVFDTVGGNGTLTAGIELTRRGGSVVLFAHAPDGEHADFDLNNLFKFERRIIGTYSAALAEQQEVLDLILAGKLDPAPLVTHLMPLDDFEHGVDLVVRHQALKVLFTPSEASE